MSVDARDQLQRAVSGRFSIERELGRGGMGIVYLARDVALDRPVAIKLLPPAIADQSAHRQRFLSEARTAAGLSHPNIVPIHLVEETADLVYFVMGFVDGESVGDRVRRAGPMDPADVARLVQEVAWALGYAHGSGVIHRDIKPDNILIDRGSGRALVTDFGIARVSSTVSQTQEGIVFGTPSFMSPEQAMASETIDGRADLYSLGVTAFFALTGHLPFESPNPAAVVAMHIAIPAAPVLSVRSGLPPRLAEAVDCCLQKDPSARFASGKALADAIAESQVVRRELAPSVREFLAAAKNGAGQILSMWLIWIAVAEAASRVAGTVSGLAGGALDPLLAVLAALTPIVTIRPLLAARAVKRAGLDEQHVADAIAIIDSARDPHVEHELARAKRLGERLTTVWGRGLFAAIGVGMLPLFGAVLGDLLHHAPGLVWLGRLGILGWGSVMEAFLFGMAIAPRYVTATFTRGTQQHTSVLQRIWAGPFGRALFNLAGVGLRLPKSTALPGALPTEVLLGRAAADIVKELPADVRAHHGDLQTVILDLERTAVELRARRDELVKSLADVGRGAGSQRRQRLVDDLEDARDAVEERLRSAVAALENLRLDLVRLRSGLGSHDQLTAAIDEARAVGESIDREIAARREVDRLTEHSPLPM